MEQSKLIKIDKKGNWKYLYIQDSAGIYEVHTQSNAQIKYYEKRLDMARYAVYINGKFAWYTGR